MRTFLETVVRRYKGCAHLHGWDIWNELRWNVQADGLVCYCPHTLAAFRDWLDERYGGLDGLNRAWLRRYASWEEVQPGKLPSRPYTEMMAFQHFLTWRADRHAAAALRAGQGARPRPAGHGPRGEAVAASPRDAGDVRHGAEPGQRLVHGRDAPTPWASPASRGGTSRTRPTSPPASATAARPRGAGRASG